MFWQIFWTAVALFFYLVFFGKALDPYSDLPKDQRKAGLTMFGLGIIPLLALLAYIWS